MSYDLFGYYGVIPNSRPNDISGNYRGNYCGNYGYCEYTPPITKRSFAPAYKSYNNNKVYYQVITAVGTIAALVLGGIFLKKKGASIAKYLNPRNYTDKLKRIFHRKNTNKETVKKSFWTKFKNLFRRKHTDTETVKEGFWTKFKNLFRRKHTDTETVKEGFWSKFKNLFKRKQKIHNTKPPKLNPKKIFRGKKVKTEQKDGFFKRLFRKKPVNEVPPKVTSDIFVSSGAK